MMSKPNKFSGKFKFNKHQVIGAPDAETDHNLEKVFIDNGAFDVLIDVESPKCIIIGRTGSGKSALIKKLLSSEERIARIAPSSMSLRYLTNSTILEYLRSINVNLNFFYKVLWKHVFVVEILKLYLGEADNKKQSLLQHLYSRVKKGGRGDEARKAALNYFEKWSDEFWLKSEYRIKTLEYELEQKIHESLGIKLPVGEFGNFSITNDNNEVSKTSSEIKYKAEKIISEIQAEDLLNLVEILSSDVFNNVQKKFFIVIDDLDKEWVTPQIVYDLIAAMIEVIKEFQEKFIGVKIIIALRDNLHNLVFSGKEHRGGQREKFTNLYLNLQWDDDSLRELVDLRIKLLSHNQINITQLFDKPSKTNKTGFDYLVERTFLRPRDIISFFNKIIESSNSISHISDNLIKIAEPAYSIERFQALEDEWEENYGEIRRICKFLIGMHNGFRFYNIKEDSFAEYFVEQDSILSFKGELYKICREWRVSRGRAEDFRLFLRELLFILYRIGIIGIKRRPEFPIQFFYLPGAPIGAEDFDNNCRIYIHKSLYSVLKINVREQEIDSFE